jgi:hypothetical protein
MRGPREAASKRWHENTVAGPDAISVGSFRNRNRNRSRRQIPIAIKIRKRVIAGNSKTSCDRLDDAKVRLVRNHEINIIRLIFDLREYLARSLNKAVDRLTEDFWPVEIPRVFP